MNYKDISSWTHLKEISGSNLLVSLHHSCYKSANIEVFNLANKGSPKKIYQFDEVIGGRFTTSNIQTDSSFFY